jgi:hypothetical protein
VGGNEDDRRRVAASDETVLQVEATELAKVYVQDDALRLATDGAREELLSGTESLDADSIALKDAAK